MLNPENFAAVLAFILTLIALVGVIAAWVSTFITEKRWMSFTVLGLAILSGGLAAITMALLAIYAVLQMIAAAIISLRG
jgi:hypothetical protein